MSKDVQGYKIVLGVIGADCHAVGNRILTAVLTQAGVEVVNLGVMASQEEFSQAALTEGAGAQLAPALGRAAVGLRGGGSNDRSDQYGAVNSVAGFAAHPQLRRAPVTLDTARISAPIAALLQRQRP